MKKFGLLLMSLMVALCGCKKDEQVVHLKVTTGEVTNITGVSAKVSLEVAAYENGNKISTTQFQECGICWNSKSQPTPSNNAIKCRNACGEYVCTLTGLKQGTTYYARAYIKSGGNIIYGEEVTFSTPALAKIKTYYIGEITGNSALIKGRVLSNGGASVEKCGFQYGKEENNLNKTQTAILKGNSFQTSLSSLEPATTYYVKAYVTTAAGTSYSTILSFTTLSLPTVELLTAEESGSVITCEMQVKSNESTSIVEGGICYSNVNAEPAETNTKLPVEGCEVGTKYTQTISNVSTAKPYYIRAYARNSVGTAYSNVIVISRRPTVVTEKVRNISYTSATCSGNVTLDGGAAVSERGVCYSTATNPTISDSKVMSGTGTGAFSCELRGLTDNTTYYVCAYAINKEGISYGEIESFMTKAATLPLITSGGVSNITCSSAICEGNVTSDGGLEVTERGICYSTTTNPTISDNKVMSGTGTGAFSCTLSGLTAGTKYYVRTYAVNAKGTSYGERVDFTTDIMVFSVSANQKVVFAPGNLQYQACTNTWRFAEHQYDYIGDDNSNISTTYSGWIDLFCWGTGGDPTNTSSLSIFDDWGNNVIDDYAANTWRTLTSDEWDYVFFKRNNAKNLYGTATVNGITGVILLPDSWISPVGLNFYNGNYKYTNNIYTTAQWLRMESAGAIFLPAAGMRQTDQSVGNVQSQGRYWSSTGSGRDYAYALFWIADYVIGVDYNYYGTTNYRTFGLSVRLAREL